MSAIKQYDGSRRHILDLVESKSFLTTVQKWIGDQGYNIPVDTIWMPKSWIEPKESRLFASTSPFLGASQRAEMHRWWLAHSGNIPNWDLIIRATTTTGKPALVLVEAKAHTGEFDRCKKRKTPEAKKRTEENHQQVSRAIEEACCALKKFHPGISISLDRCYQLSNRIAMAWKLASMGIPTVLVFLGFLGDVEMDDFFSDDNHWRQEFAKYATGCFPVELIGQDIPCGTASFRVVSHSLPIQRPSSPLDERRQVRSRQSAT